MTRTGLCRRPAAAREGAFGSRSRRATRAIRDAGLDIGIVLDVALDPYTSHGHDGLVIGDRLHQDGVVVVVLFLVLLSDLLGPEDGHAKGAHVVLHPAVFRGDEIRQGQILGSDRFFKVAVVKIEPVEGVQPLALATGLGSPVDASIGIPFGLDSAVRVARYPAAIEIERAG